MWTPPLLAQAHVQQGQLMLCMAAQTVIALSHWHHRCRTCCSSRFPQAAAACEVQSAARRSAQRRSQAVRPPRSKGSSGSSIQQA
jgi:hypothetical protein